MSLLDLTPVERRGKFWFKRDDLFTVAGVRGGKVRTCWHLSKGAKGLVTAGSRASPQVNIVASIAKEIGIPCRVHTPEGELSPEVRRATEKGAEVIQHKAGYNSVIVARAREDAEVSKWTNIPFGIECQEAVEQTRKQVANLPPDIKRLVVPVGSGMSLAGILYGLKDVGRASLLVLGVQVGGDVARRLRLFAPLGYESGGHLFSGRFNVTIEEAEEDYHDEAIATECEGVKLDPIYEAKCINYLEPGDCLWVVGIRETAI